MLEIVSAEARKKLEDQLNTVDAVDQKIGVILGFVGVVLVVAFNNKPNQPMATIILSVKSIFIRCKYYYIVFGLSSN